MIVRKHTEKNRQGSAGLQIQENTLKRFRGFHHLSDMEMQYAWLSKIILLENGNEERINLQIQIIFNITCLAKFVLKRCVSFIWNKIRFYFFFWRWKCKCHLWFDCLCNALSVIEFYDYFNLGYSMFLAFSESQMFVIAAQMCDQRYKMPSSERFSSKLYRGFPHGP